MKWSIYMLFVFLPVFVSAQSFNGSFENWQTDTSKFPQSWLVSGHVFPAESYHEGNAAVKMENKSDGSFGFISTTPDVRYFSGGHAYNEMPLSLKFRAKYELSPGDAGVVAVIFKYRGNPIGTATVYVQGSSLDTFAAFSVPVVWQQSILPDSVVLVASSANLLDNEAPTGEGYMILDDLQFTSINTIHSPPPNAGFELWRDHYRYSPTQWITADQVFAEDAGPGWPYTLVERSENAKTGSSGVLLRNAQFPGSRNATAGFILTGSNTQIEQQLEKPAFSVDMRWNFLSGWYQFQRGGNDSAYVHCLMFKQGQIIGLASFNNFEPTTEWRDFNLPITYYSNEEPDSASIFISSSNPERAESADTRLLVDGVRFSEQILSIEESILTDPRVALFPNPCTGIIHLTNVELRGSYLITDLQGREVKSGILDSNSLNVTDLSCGSYILTVSNQHYNQRIKFIKL
jgi:hypothetical protein